MFPSTEDLIMNISFLESTTISTTTTERTTIVFTPTTTRTATANRRLLFTHKPWVYYIFNSSRSSRTTTTTTNLTTKSIKSSSALSSILKTTLPLPTPWYPSDSFLDWLIRHSYTTKFKKSPIKFPLTTQPSTISTQTTSTTRRTSTTTTPIITTTTPIITTTIPITTTTTTESTTRSTKKTSAITTTTKPETTADWFKWPSQQAGFKDDYTDWIEYLPTNHIQTIITSTVTTSTLASISTRHQYQQIGFLATKPNWKVITINTPPAKRDRPQQRPSVNERNAVGIQNNGINNLIYLSK
jgi:hypothetical protein